MSDDENDSVHTPTQSEFATFEILANRDYTNMSKKKPRSRDLRGSFPVDVVEEEDLSHEDTEDEEEYDEEDDDNLNTPQPLQPLMNETQKSQDLLNTQNYDESLHNQNTQTKEKVHFDNSVPSYTNLNYTSSIPIQPNPNPESFSNPQLPFFEKNEKSEKSEKSKAYYESVENERRDEKEGLLTELLQLAESGQCKLVRTLTMKDSLEEISFQYDRCQAEMEARKMVNFAKSSIDVGASVIEMVAKNFGFGLLDGYHKSLCSDMNRFDRPLTKIYKKYWRRGSQKPEMELAMIIIGSFGWTVMSNMMKDGSYLKKVFGGSKSKSKEEDLKPKDKEMESIKSKFSASSPPVTPPSPTNSNTSVKKMMRPPTSNINIASPWVQVSNSPKIEIIEENTPKNEPGKDTKSQYDHEKDSALQSLKLKEIEMERRMERLAKMEEEMSKRLNSSSTSNFSSSNNILNVPLQIHQNQQNQQSQQQIQQKDEKDRPKMKSLSELANSDIELFDDDDEYEGEDEDEVEVPDTRRVVVISSPPPSGRKSGRKTTQKPPVVKL